MNSSFHFDSLFSLISSHKSRKLSLLFVHFVFFHELRSFAILFVYRHCVTYHAVSPIGPLRCEFMITSKKMFQFFALLPLNRDKT